MAADKTSDNAAHVTTPAATAFEAQVVEHMDALFAVACRLTKNPSEAQDVVQDTLIKAMRARDQFREGTNLKAWLFRILTNTFINHYRRGGLERAIFDGPDAEPLVDGWMSASTMRHLRNPEEVALLPIVEGEVRTALNALPEEFRIPVILSDMEDFSYEEIAEVMACPVGTVMSRLHRGRKLLKKSLFEHAVALGIIPAGHGDQAAEEPANLEAYRAQKRKAVS
jgi:RNA polymerase sigma-70 factor, ECF subfamily